MKHTSYRKADVISWPVQGLYTCNPVADPTSRTAGAAPDYMVRAQPKNVRTGNVWKNQTRFGTGETQGKGLTQTGEDSKACKATVYS